MYLKKKKKKYLQKIVVGENIGFFGKRYFFNRSAFS